jgi:hypothetical protein
MKLYENANYEVDILIPGFHFVCHDLNAKEALEKVDSIVTLLRNDWLTKTHEQNRESFGFVGSSKGKEYNYHISASRPVKKTDDPKFTCLRRMDKTENQDEWQLRGEDKCCSYCGSMHPERVLELIQKHGFGIVESTTKDYKRYINRSDIPNAGFGGIKFYIYHFNEDQIKRYNALIDLHKKG